MFERLEAFERPPRPIEFHLRDRSRIAYSDFWTPFPKPVHKSVCGEPGPTIQAYAHGPDTDMDYPLPYTICNECKALMGMTQ